MMVAASDRAAKLTERNFFFVVNISRALFICFKAIAINSVKNIAS